MSVDDVSTIFAVQFDQAVDSFVVGCQTIGISPNVAALIQSGDGFVDPTLVAAGRIKPTSNFTSNDVKNALDIIGLDGKPLSATSIMKMFLQKVAQGATRTAGAAHTMLEMNEGIVVPISLAANDGLPATISYLSTFTYDGSNIPIKVTESQALPTITASTTIHTTGPISVNGAAIGGVQSLSLDFGIDLVALGGDGEVYDTFVGIMNRAPSLKFNTTNADIMKTFEEPVPIGSTVIAYFTKMLPGSIRVADNVAEHIKLTMTSGMVNNETLSLNQGANGTVDGIVHLSYDGSNDIAQINTASVIT